MFETITSLERLEQAWHKTRGNAGAAGGDGVTVQAFSAQAPIQLIRLQRDLRNGTYAPGPVRHIQIPKNSGGLRPLAIPCVVDRIAQTAAAMVLGPVLEEELEESSFAYRPGRSVQMAVRKVDAHRRDGFDWVVDGDIERYFENVPHDLLIRRLEKSIQDPLTIDLRPRSRDRSRRA